MVMIEVLESGYCPKCGVVKERVLKIAKEMNIEVKIVDPLKEPERLIELGVLTSPVVVINGEVVFEGVIPSEDKLREVIKRKLNEG